MEYLHHTRMKVHREDRAGLEILARNVGKSDAGQFGCELDRWESRSVHAIGRWRNSPTTMF
jgi:hypothetical protein